MLVHWRRVLQGGLRWEKDLKKQRKERKATGKLHVSEAAWAAVMRTREGANGDQIARGLAPSSPFPSLLKREAQRQDVSGKGPLFHLVHPLISAGGGGGPGVLKWEAAIGGERMRGRLESAP